MAVTGPDPSDLDRLEELFEEALALPPERREAFVDEHVGSDPELRDELLALLARADEDPDFLDRLGERVVGPRAREALMALEHGRLADALRERYRLRRRIGRGGMATVYLADDLRHERRVAVKVLQPELAAAVGAERFLAEIRTTANLQHPHILPLFDSGEADGFLYYVMPYVEGESLRERLDRQRQLPVEEAVGIAADVAEALDYAHRQGIVHRDLKPGNVLLHEGRPLLMDFGIALALEGSDRGGRLTQTGHSLGTPLYMSPEQATGQGTVGPPSDLYSLGCMLHEMLVGEPPHTGPTPQAILTGIMTGEVAPLTERRRLVPAHVDAAVRRALEKLPADRFSTARDFSDALADPSFRHEVPEVGAGRGTSDRRSRLLPWLLGAVVLAAGIWAVTVVPRDPSAGPVATEPGPVAAPPTVIAVFPFRTSGPGLEHLGEGLMDLLSRSLPQSDAIATVDPRTVMKGLRARVPDGDMDVPQAVSLAREMGATAALLGSAVSAGGELRLDAVVYGSGLETVATGAARGSTEEPFALADELAVSVVRDLWSAGTPIPNVDAGAVLTRSPDALRSWLEGERRYREGDILGGREALEQAVALDSTFTLARYRLGWALAWTEGPGAPQTVAELRAALRHGERLPPRERTVLEAFLMFAEDRLEEGHEFLEPFLGRWPDDPEAWIVMANYQYHHPRWMGLDADQILEPFDRVIALDSSLVAAYFHPLDIALHNRDRRLFERYMEPLLRRVDLNEAPRVARYVEWGDACFGGQGEVGPVAAEERLSGEPTPPPPCTAFRGGPGDAPSEGAASASGADREEAAPPSLATSADSEARPSIAVLPFRDMSASGDQAYLGEGVAEEILNALAKIPGLRVAARTSAFRLRDQDISEVAERLGVTTVLEGSVRQEADSVRITAQLIDGETNSHLWSDQYDRKHQSYIAIQEDIAQRVVDALRVELLARGAPLISASTDDSRAYELYLLGRHHWNRRSGEDFREAVAAFREALSLDPDFALAYSGLADAYVLLFEYNVMSPDEALPLARAAAERALELDPTLAEAHASLAEVLAGERRWEEADERFRRALELNPGYLTAHHWYGWLLTHLARHEEAIEYLEGAKALDPLSHIVRQDLAAAYYHAGRFQEAADESEACVEAQLCSASRDYGRSLLAMGRAEAALVAARAADDMLPDPARSYAGMVVEVTALATLGRDAEARRLLADYLEGGPPLEYPITQLYLAEMYVALGDHEAALGAVERAEELGLATGPILIREWPAFDAIRDHPRYVAVLERMGYPP